MLQEQVSCVIEDLFQTCNLSHCKKKKKSQILKFQKIYFYLKGKIT